MVFPPFICELQLSNNHLKLQSATETETAEKSKLWFVNPEVVDHYYYITVGDDGNAVYHEIANGKSTGYSWPRIIAIAPLSNQPHISLP